MALTQITGYQCQYSSNLFPPRIFLKNGDKIIGQLIFLSDGTELPPDNESGGQVNLYYHLENYQHAHATLSEVKEVYLLYSGTGPGYENGLQSGWTPPGNEAG